MSRIGRAAITIPAGVTVTQEGELVKVEGKLGKLSQYVDKCITVHIENGIITLTRSSEENEVKAKHGLYRALILNMVKGVSEGFSKTLTIKGVGYKAVKQGNKLVLSIGFSQPKEIFEEEGIKIDCPSIAEIKISGYNKEKVGQFAAKIRDLRPVEPYHAYGVKYNEEVVIRKQGKTAGKGKGKK